VAVSGVVIHRHKTGVVGGVEEGVCTSSREVVVGGTADGVVAGHVIEGGAGEGGGGGGGPVIAELVERSGMLAESSGDDGACSVSLDCELQWMDPRSGMDPLSLRRRMYYVWAAFTTGAVATEQLGVTGSSSCVAASPKLLGITAHHVFSVRGLQVCSYLTLWPTLVITTLELLRP
jgi:hypothetical protein